MLYGACMTPGNRCTCTNSMDNNLIYSEWGYEIFSLPMGVEDFAKSNGEALYLTNTHTLQVILVKNDQNKKEKKQQQVIIDIHK